MKATRTYNLRQIVEAFLDDIQNEAYDDALYNVGYSADGMTKVVTYEMHLNEKTTREK